MIKSKLNSHLYLLIVGAAGMVLTACSSSGQSGSNIYTTLSNQPKGNNTANGAQAPTATGSPAPNMNYGNTGSSPQANVTNVEPEPGYDAPPPPRVVRVNVYRPEHRRHRIPFIHIEFSRY